ncbi:MAG: [acyl-carrier-protein] S-malonyltransferase [Thermodesulfobacteriota bacterium]|nr:[acyl-carrier-protein] S-malonyltransferase [Thermodesulfobacteriota bacterium]
MEKWALVFPGQGSQYVGMGADLFKEFGAFRDVFSRTRDVTGMDIAKICLEGPQGVLDQTVHTQLAVLTFELATYELFKAHIGIGTAAPTVAAGHSLGEYSALYAAGSLRLEETIAIVQARARRHQEALPPGVGAMAAILGLDHEAVAKVCKRCSLPGEPLDLANLNAPNQIVISGNARAVERVGEMAREAGIKKFVPLPISVPCHSRLLREAAELFSGDLAKIAFQPCLIPVVPNYDPSRLHSPDCSRELLQRQMVSPVRWQETVERMTALGVKTVVEIGPRKVLSGLIKNIDRHLRLLYVGDGEALLKAASSL